MIYSSQQLKQRRKNSGNTFKKKLHYQLKTQKLYKVYKGIYATTPPHKLTRDEYLKLGGLLYTPCYLSLETVLYDAGILFQYTSTLTYIGPYTLDKTIQGNQLSYKKLPLRLLVRTTGLYATKHGYTATPERALCDLLYHNIHYPLDVLPKTLNKELLIQIATYYSHIKGQKALPSRIHSLL